MTPRRGGNPRQVVGPAVLGKHWGAPTVGAAAMKATWSFPAFWGLPGGGRRVCLPVPPGRGAPSGEPREFCEGVAFELDKGWEVFGQMEMGRRCFLRHPHLPDFRQSLASLASYSSLSSTSPLPQPEEQNSCFPLCNHSFLPFLAQATQLPKARPSCLPSCPSPFAASHPVGPGRR